MIRLFIHAGWGALAGAVPAIIFLAMGRESFFFKNGVIFEVFLSTGILLGLITGSTSAIARRFKERHKSTGRRVRLGRVFLFMLAGGALGAIPTIFYLNKTEAGPDLTGGL